MISLAIFCMLVSVVGAQNESLDQLQCKLALVEDEKQRVDVLNQIALKYEAVNPDSTFEISKRAEKLARSIGYKKGLAEAYRVKGIYFERVGSHIQALQSLQNALDIALEIDDRYLSGAIYNNMGIIQAERGRYEDAIENFMHSAAIDSAHHDFEGLAKVLNNIGWALKLGHQPNKAIPYLLKALALGESENLEIFGGLYPTYNLGSAYLQLQEYDSALLYLRKALSVSKKRQNNYIICLSSIDLGNLFLQKQDYLVAKEYLETAYATAIRFNLLKERRDAAFLLSSLFEEMNETEKALNYFKDFHNTKDSLFNEKITSQITAMEAKTRYEMEQKQLELIHQLEASEREQKLNRALWLRNSFLVAFLFVCIIGALTYRNYVLKVRDNQKLQELNKQIIEQKEELFQQSEELALLNESLNELNNHLEDKVRLRTLELKRKNEELENKNAQLAEYAFYNAHKLRAPIATSLGLIKLFENPEVGIDEKHLIVEKLKESTLEINHAVKEIRQILERENLIFET